MKKYLLTLLAIFLVLAPNVKAEECVNLYPYEPGTLYFNSVYQVSWWTYFSSKQIENLDKSKTYTFYALKNNQLVEKLDPYSLTLKINYKTGYRGLQSVTLNNISSFQADWQVQQKTTTDDDIYKELQSWQLWLVEGDTVCIPKTEPDPEPDTPVADATLDNFYSIYLSKLSSLATFATENKIFFSALGLLLSFAIFELFFMLFRGRRKMK
ncbi:MAG: hypothetical protein PUD25_02435 [Bacilli bacterium]|nr:hypothetical protein [Bacilli bacterium]